MKLIEKKRNLTLLLLLFVCLVMKAQNEEVSTETLPGDNFNLTEALYLFEKSTSLEDFEKNLNNEENKVNNLDLNKDNEIDYIRVVDNMDGDVHAIVLQVPLNEKESQDIAVIEIEKTGEEEAILQIIGDEDVYGENKIIEPVDEEVKMEGKGPSIAITTTRLIVNVYFWPSVRFIYAPTYRVYVSPWRWGFYPRFWRPWRPHPVRTFVSFFVPRPHFRVTHTHRVVRAHRVYVPKRRTTKTVRTRTTVDKNKRGKTVGIKKNKTTTVRNKNGKVVGKKKTTVKKHRGRKSGH